MRRDAKNGRARPGYFINISFRCLSLPRRGAARQRRRTRPASGHRYPHPLPRAAGTQGGRKGGGEGEKESVEKKGRQIYIYVYVYIERRRGGDAASPERGRGALYYIERRNVAAEIVSSPSSRPSPANKDEVSANIILVTGYSPGETTTSLYIHPLVASLKSFETWQRWMPLDGFMVFVNGVYRWIPFEFSFWKSFSTELIAG